MTVIGLNPRHNYQSPFNYSERITELKNKVQNFERRMGISDKVTLEISNFNDSAAAKPGQNIIKLPVWFLFHYEDIPPRFRVRDINDPRLSDRNFLNDAADWMNQKVREMGLSSISRPVDQGSLQIYLKMLRDPELFEKSKDFTIGHELGHIGYSQSKMSQYNLQAGLDAVSIGGVMTGLFVLFLAVALLPLVHVTVTIGVACVAVAITVGGVVAWLNKPQTTPALTAIEEEKKADFDSVEMLGDATGGIYFFDTHAKHNQLLRRHNAVSPQSVDERGNNLNDRNHPPLTDRVSYLRRWQAEHLLRE